MTGEQLDWALDQACLGGTLVPRNDRAQAALVARATERGMDFFEDGGALILRAARVGDDGKWLPPYQALCR